MHKILVIVPFPMSEENLNSRRDQLKAVKLTSEVKFEFRSTKAAPKNYISETDMVLADIGILEVGIKAQKEGFSAVCVDTMSDSGVSALRSCLDIPVIGPGQTSMLCAMMMGNKFSIVTMWKSWFHLYDRTIERLGIKESWGIEYVQKTYKRWFQDGKEPATEPNISEICNELKIDKDKVIEKAKSEEIEKEYLANTDSARKDKVFGSPSFIVNNEIFWGDDRMEDAISWSKK